VGKYTSLARSFRDEEPLSLEEEKKSIQRNTYVNINRKEYIEDSNSLVSATSGDTTLRPTTLTTLIGDEKDEKRTVTCIHGISPSACGVCSGYSRWLIEDESRLRRAQVRPEEVRREFWRSVKGGWSRGR
jgi:hypothetical protein